MSTLEGEQLPISQLNEENDAVQVSLDADTLVDVDKVVASPCPLRIYTRPQLLRLYSSPLVGPPLGMPELKEWFGPENEQNLNKRDTEPSAPNSARERRFRRDAEDAGKSTSSFEAALIDFLDSSSRSTFRSSLSQPSQMGNFKHQSLRGNDRDGDKDKERDIRDKEGQERLRNLSEKYDRDRLALPAGNRTKDREPAPHLAAGSSRISGPQLSAVPGRRSEVGRKKNGEGEDWRRATDNRRSGREERSDRARSRSRARDSSRPRRDRDKEDKKEKEKERDHRRGDKEDDPRKDKDAEDEDTRRWKDDGKRDERMAARRERERTAREKDAPKDGSDRWIDDRDSRPKRNSGKDKKSTTVSEEVWDRDRTDKEKEPAWMDTYIPPPSGAGILGGKGPDGELDGIQVWKRGIKEKEQREKDSLKESSDNNLESSERLDSSAEPLDEIQQFKLMMKREQERMQASPNVISSLDPSDGQAPEALTNVKPSESPSPPSENSLLAKSTHIPTQSLLSILTSGDPGSSHSKNISSSTDSTGRAATSRLFPNPISHDGTLATENVPPQSSRFTPPQGSRLLALGNRSSTKAALPTTVSQQMNGSPSTSGTYVDTTISEPPRLDAQRPPSGFLPFEEPHPYVLDEQKTIVASAAHRIERPDSAGQTDIMPPDPTGYAPSKGSRFAKFFDGKAKDSTVPKAQIGAMASSTTENQRHDTEPAERTMDDLFVMLNNSVQRSGQMLPTSHSFGQQGQMQLSQAVPPSSQSQPHHRLEPLYESRMDNRNFVPDGMVPGLRPAPPPRNRDNGGMFGEHIEESLSYNGQRVVPMAQRGPEPTYSGLGASVYPHAVRNGQLQAHYRGGPSPISNTQPSLQQNTHLQRLPPGLANLGGRPPHEPSHFSNMHGISSSALHGSLHGGMIQAQSPPQFNNIGFGGQTHVRMSPVQLQNSSSVQQGLGPSNVDIRTSTQAQLLGLGGGRGGFPQGPNAMQNPLLAIRQQQQLVMPHMVPHQLQQAPPSNNNTHDLMALLMGGHQRE